MLSGDWRLNQESMKNLAHGDVEGSTAELAASVAHELNNISSLLIVAHEYLVAPDFPKGAPKARTALDCASIAARTLSAPLSLLSISQDDIDAMVAGNHVCRVEPEDWGDVFDAVHAVSGLRVSTAGFRPSEMVVIGIDRYVLQSLFTCIAVRLRRLSGPDADLYCYTTTESGMPKSNSRLSGKRQKYVFNFVSDFVPVGASRLTHALDRLLERALAHSGSLLAAVGVDVGNAADGSAKVTLWVQQ